MIQNLDFYVVMYCYGITEFALRYIDGDKSKNSRGVLGYSLSLG
jgi:hypothetical protein